MQVAERNTWPKVEMIRSHCAVEMALEQCVQTLRRQLTAENQVSLPAYLGLAAAPPEVCAGVLLCLARLPPSPLRGRV